MKLNLGCGYNYIKGYVNVDNSNYVKKDVKCDLDKYPLPFKDNSIDEILSMAIIEHLKDNFKFMEEIHRILKPGGTMKFRVPMAFTFVDARDPSHKQHFIPRTFDVYLKGFKSYKVTDIKFKGKIWITMPFFHKIRFSKKLYYLNSIINNLFTGIEGELIKIDNNKRKDGGNGK